MSQKVFITDCEGPLTLNDNAFEIASYFIKNGDELYKILSSYDDYLVEVEKKEGYHVGGTLTFIVPFLKAADITNNDIINYSKDNIHYVPGIDNVFAISNNRIDSYIVSTSYGQYIKALSEDTGFKYDNTYYTYVDLDMVKISEEEKSRINDFREDILKCDLIGDYRENIEDENLKYQGDLLDDIFFNKIPELEVYKIMENMNPVGGIEKEKAVKDILFKNNIDIENVMYVGDSITDLEPLEYVKENNGLAISFNGNKYAINAADYAIITDDAIALTIILDLFSRIGKYYTLNFIDSYNFKPDGMYQGFRISHTYLDYYKEHYEGKEYPIITKITDDNRDELIKKSESMRNRLRGDDIGSIM